MDMQMILMAVVLVTVIGLIGAVILVVASIVMYVPVDERVEQITGVLAGANCGACGCAGCADYAKSIVEDGNAINKCIPGGASCAAAIALGTMAGGWRIIRTLGAKVARLQPVHGCAAEVTASAILMTTAYFGMPISTTHVITACIMDVGAVKRLNAVRWSIAYNIAGAWIMTLPAAAAIAAASYYVIRYLDPGLQ